ncbi:MAG TPA: Trm112 family protein [Trebonia sp.]|nr:Trm112 family protein [Trebonia sp.]
MELEDWVLDIIVCPKCHAALRAEDAASELVCTGCGLAYPVRDNIPVLLIEEARKP